MITAIRITALALLALSAPANAGQVDRNSTLSSAAMPERANRDLFAGPGRSDSPNIHGLTMPEARTLPTETAFACETAAAGHVAYNGPDRSGLAVSWTSLHLSRDSACSQG